LVRGGQANVRWVDSEDVAKKAVPQNTQGLYAYYKHNNAELWRSLQNSNVLPLFLGKLLDGK
jgi:hypothetical protein